MKPEQQRIAIAETLGWKDCKYIEGLRDVCGIPPDNWKWDCIGGIEFAWTPNYLEDLNAMHKAEMNLKTEDHHAYGCYCSNLYEDYGNTVSLTATERAEAFLRTLGKWKGRGDE